MSYVELHARSAFSFLRGGSIPEDVLRAALEAKLPAVALLDRDGVYGAPRFYSSALENQFAVRPRVGAEITMEDGSVVPLLVVNRKGYQNLCQLITEAKLVERAPSLAIPDLPPHVDPHERKRPCFATWSELARFNEGLIALTGDEEGPVRRAWRTEGKEPAAAALHLARTVCRRAERLMVHLAADPAETVGAPAIKYVNRLSDFLFVAARAINAAGSGDVLWVPGENR